jgi:four helix bundle protein
MRRAAVSAMANIAEGFERDGDREFIQSLAVAKGSAGEVRSCLTAAFDIGLIDAATHEQVAGLAIETSRLIAGLMRYLKNSTFRGKKFSLPDD